MTAHVFPLLTESYGGRRRELAGISGKLLVWRAKKSGVARDLFTGLVPSAGLCRVPVRWFSQMPAGEPTWSFADLIFSA
jgi:hypothetical protein